MNGKINESVSTLMFQINKRSINGWLRNLCKTNKWQVEENSGGNQALEINVEGKKIVKHAAAGSLSLDSFFKKEHYGYLAILVKV